MRCGSGSAENPGTGHRSRSSAKASGLDGYLSGARGARGARASDTAQKYSRRAACDAANDGCRPRDAARELEGGLPVGVSQRLSQPLRFRASAWRSSARTSGLTVRLQGQRGDAVAPHTARTDTRFGARGEKQPWLFARASAGDSQGACDDDFISRANVGRGSIKEKKGDTQIRTGDGGFADPCLTTWLCRRSWRNFVGSGSLPCPHCVQIRSIRLVPARARYKYEGAIFAWILPFRFNV